MSNFLDWLEVEARGFEVVSLILKVLIFDLAWNFLILIFLFAAGGSLTSDIFLLMPMPDKINADFAVFIFAAAMIEEAIFRFTPLLIAVAIKGKSPRIVHVMIISSLIFGVMHGGPINILFQGVGGFLFCIVFLKCGGFQKRPLKALLSSTTAHFLFNMTIFSIGIIAKGMML